MALVGARRRRGAARGRRRERLALRHWWTGRHGLVLGADCGRSVRD